MARRPEYRRMHTGSAYLRAREEMFLYYGHTCWLCGHEGANDADYIIPASVDPEQDPGDAHNKRPAHGSNSPCPTCGRKCNQSRGNRAPSIPLITSEDW